jgi:hypothetical protein
MKIFNPLTTATSIGVAIRYLITIAGSLLTILGIVGWLTSDQVQELSQKVQDISAQLPGLLAAAGGIIALVMPIYATITKSSTDRAAEVAKEVDKQIPERSPVVIKTPAGVPDIVVPGKGT